MLWAGHEEQATRMLADELLEQLDPRPVKFLRARIEQQDHVVIEQLLARNR